MDQERNPMDQERNPKQVEKVSRHYLSKMLGILAGFAVAGAVIYGGFQSLPQILDAFHGTVPARQYAHDTYIAEPPLATDRFHAFLPVVIGGSGASREITT